MLHNNTIVFAWQVSEFEFKEKKKNWYWVVGLIALALMLVGVLMDNYLMSFLILLGAFLMFSQAPKQPMDLDIEISEEGINIHDTMHKFETIQAFWIKEHDDGSVRLILMTSQMMTPLESIMVPPEIDPLELREYLLEFIPEEELRQSYTERIIDRIGF